MKADNKEESKRARIFAITLAFFTITSLVALLFAIYQTTEAKKESMEQARRLEDCNKEVAYWKKRVLKDSLIKLQQQSEK